MAKRVSADCEGEVFEWKAGVLKTGRSVGNRGWLKLKGSMWLDRVRCFKKVMG